MVAYRFIAGVLLLLPVVAQAQGVTFSNFSDWDAEIAVDYIQPGEDILATLTSRLDQIKLNVEIGAATFHNSFTRKWAVEVHGVFHQWPDGLDCYIRRTGDGTVLRKGQPIKGGEVFQKLDSRPRFLFRTKGWRYDIPMQLELRGLSLILLAKEYNFDVYFTIVED